MKQKFLKISTIIIFFFLVNLVVSINVFALEQDLTYQGHLQDIGWASVQNNNQICGTTGENRRMEAIIINLSQNDSSQIEYSTHVQDYGWLNYVPSGSIGGTTGQAKRLEAIKIRLTGNAQDNYDIYYRTHVQDYGWLEWVKNDAISGTTGQSKKIEAIQINLVPKGTIISSDISPSTSGSLRVSGNKLVDNNGNQVQLKGVSTHGINWYPQYVNQNLFSELKNTWNANVVRLAMYTSDYNGYCSGGNKQELKNLVKAGINYATIANLYVIVDWHILSDSNPNQYVNEAKEFFNEISSEYRNSSNIIYEICNEPNGSTSWNDIKAYAEQVIPVIRNNDNDAIILVGTPTWSQDIHLVSQNPLTYSNIMYTFHFYAGTHKDDLRNRLITTVNNGLPVFVSEFGITDASGNGNLDINSGNQWIEILNNLNISYVCWNLSNKNESSSLISSSTTKTYGLTSAELSDQGRWLLSIFGGASSTPGQNPNTGNSSNNGEINYTISLKNQWLQGSDYFYQYEITIINNTNSPINNWNITLTSTQNCSIENSWNGNFNLVNNKLTISNVDYNRTINSHSSIGDIGFIVKSNSSLQIR